MKKLALAIMITASSALGAWAGDNNNHFTVDAENSTLEWTGEKLTGFHTGTIGLSEGSFSMDQGTITSGDFKIDMNTIVCTDLAEASAAKLVNHLKSDDFFGVANHQEAAFSITKAQLLDVAGEDDPNYEITGNLTIKGITHEITFPAKVWFEGDQLIADADMTFDRSKWDVKYRSQSFFDDLGDKFIYDDIKMKLHLVAKK